MSDPAQAVPEPERVMPEHPPVTDWVAAAVNALAALTTGDRSCDVHFARDVTAVLVRAAADLVPRPS